MTRLAVLSDIHGNIPALEAVLDDVRAQGAPDAYWVLGDLTAYLPWSAGVLNRLRALPNASCLQGNVDRYVITGYRPPVPVRSPEVWARMSGLLAIRAARFRWTVERLSYADYVFLRDLPAQLQMDIPGYGRLVAVHATPGDDEAFILPHVPDEEIRARLGGLHARLLLCGHTHIPLDRCVGGMRLVNGGSVGLPRDGDPRATYAQLDIDGGRCSVALRRVAYDIETTIKEMERLDYPARDLLAEALRRGA